MVRREFRFEGYVLLYLLVYLPNIVVTKLITSIPHQTLGRPLTGLETLPATLMISTVITYLFIWLSGWHRDAHSIEVAAVRVPAPTRYTFLSGVGTALVLFTVPLSFTFKGVSIPFIQLLMRGDILLIAPVVDLLFGRRVRWWSWVALAMVLAALIVTLRDRGSLGLPPLAILTVLLYTGGYFLRLAIMTKVSKGQGRASVRKYFVEEKVVAMPLSVLLLALISASGFGSQAGELQFGFLGVWTDPVLLPLIFIAVTMTAVAVLSILILLDPRENSYCVPMERAAGLLAGIMAAFVLAWIWGLPAPRPAELAGAVILIGAVVLLSLAPRLSQRRAAARAEAI
ncbi:hypothetical protein ACX40Y_10545 [Sphingomonas sp. RS6]